MAPVRSRLYQAKQITCKDCGNSFEFSVRDQMFYAERGFENEPQRCRDCRSARKAQRAQAPEGVTGSREMHEAVCAQCGTETTVPFKPRGDRPVYCRNCYTAQQLVRA